MARPRSDDSQYEEKRARFEQARASTTSLRDSATFAGISLSTAQEWDRERRDAHARLPDMRTQLRETLEMLIDEGYPEEVGRASQVYWRVRLVPPPNGATAWSTEHLAEFASHEIDTQTPREFFGQLGEEGHGLWLRYLAAMGRRAGLVQCDDGTWVADPDREPPLRA